MALTAPYVPSIKVSPQNFGTHYELAWEYRVRPQDICLGGNGRIYLAAKITDPKTDLPTYEMVSFNRDGKDQHTWALPDGVRMPDLFRNEHGDVWMLATTESANTEMEVLLPVSATESIKGRRRFAASQEQILRVRDGVITRFCADSYREKDARIVADPLDAKGKRRDWKLPKKPYPAVAAINGDTIHTLSWLEEDGQCVHSIYDNDGKARAAFEISLAEVDGDGGVQPIAMHNDGGGIFLTSHHGAIGIANAAPGKPCQWRAILPLPGKNLAAYSIFAVKQNRDGISLAHFTYGPQIEFDENGVGHTPDDGVSGNGWLAWRGDTLLDAWVNDPASKDYLDTKGNRHHLEKENMVLSDQDVSDDGRIGNVFYAMPDDSKVVHVTLHRF